MHAIVWTKQSGEQGNIINLITSDVGDSLPLAEIKGGERLSGAIAARVER